MTVINKMFVKVLLLLTMAACVTFLSGCGRSPAVKFYTLSAVPVTTATAELSLNLAVGPADFPRYLDRKQIVTRISESQVGVDEYHVWGASLESGFLDSVGANLTSRLAGSRVAVYPSQSAVAVDYQILFDVMAFEGVRGESAALKTQWSIIRPKSGEVVAAGIFEKTQQVADGDQSYDALVIAYSKTIGHLSDAVAMRLREVGKPASE